VEGQLPALVASLPLRAAERRGHFLRLELGDRLLLVLNFMLAGRLRLAEPEERTEAALCFALQLSGGQELRYLDDRKMGKAYVVPADREDLVPGLGALGVEVLSPAFTRETFRALVAKRRDQVRAFLMDKSALSAIGNAYADEILFEARVHPKTFCRKLAPDQVDALHAAIGQVLRAAVAEVARRQAPLEEKVRDFLQVRGRAGLPCPRCGAKLRTARVVDADACFCPECQPAERKLFIDWRKVSAR
jgi:formamidopyrimidine-DNA glycosylase